MEPPRHEGTKEDKEKKEEEKDVITGKEGW
jgi:hypothetical protein